MMQQMKRAKVDTVDAKIEQAVSKRDNLCVKMAKAVRADQNAMMAELIAVTTEINHLQFERAEIIRNTFYRPAAGR